MEWAQMVPHWREARQVQRLSILMESLMIKPAR